MIYSLRCGRSTCSQQLVLGNFDTKPLHTPVLCAVRWINYIRDIGFFFTDCVLLALQKTSSASILCWRMGFPNWNRSTQSACEKTLIFRFTLLRTCKLRPKQISQSNWLFGLSIRRYRLFIFVFLLFCSIVAGAISDLFEQHIAASLQYERERQINKFRISNKVQFVSSYLTWIIKSRKSSYADRSQFATHWWSDVNVRGWNLK